MRGDCRGSDMAACFLGVVGDASTRRRRKHGDPFPLPACDLQSQLAHHGLCMPQRGHWICTSLSKLAIPEFNPYTHTCAQRPTVVQQIALDRIKHALLRDGNPDGDLSPASCLQDMLNGQSLYEEMPSNLSAYDPNKLKVLRSPLKPQPLRSRLPPTCSEYL